MSSPPPSLPVGRAHLEGTERALASLGEQCQRIGAWASLIASVAEAGGRVLVAGNGGSAAQAQHLSGELVGRYRDDRRPIGAVALHADTSAFTAICNDYGAEECFARQVVAHGRPGDVLVALSTSGESANVLAAVRSARRLGATTLGLTGPAPNSLARACDEALCIDAPTTASVQEGHLVAVHMLCAALDVALGVAEPALLEEVPS